MTLPPGSFGFCSTTVPTTHAVTLNSSHSILVRGTVDELPAAPLVVCPMLTGVLDGDA